jgi:hypothetical protein
MDSFSLVDFDGIEMDGLEFCQKVFGFFEALQSSDGGASEIRLRRSAMANKLVGELLPICTYILAKYWLGNYMFVRWMNGSQTFDAELVTKGFYPKLTESDLSKEYLEVTISMDPNEYLGWQALEQNGVHFGRGSLRRSGKQKVVSQPINGDRDFVAEDAILAIEAITRKSKINYPENTTLIMPCYLAMPYCPFEWDRFSDLVKIGLPNNRFKEIFIFEESGKGYKTFIKGGLN